MAYNMSSGSRDFGDISYEDDTDTQIDFGSDSITFKTNDIARLYITNEHVSSSLNLSASAFYGDGSQLQNLPAGAPAGADRQVQFNNGGSFGANANLKFTAANVLTVSGDVSGSGTLQVVGDTFIGGDLKASGSLRARQIQVTHHAWTSTSTNTTYVPFYDLAEHTSTSPGYKVGMIAPFNGRLLRVMFRPQSGQSGAVTVGVHTGSNTDSGVDTLPIETVTVTPVNNVYTTSVYNFTDITHFTAESFIGVSINPNNATNACTAICVWEFDMSEI